MKDKKPKHYWGNKAYPSKKEMEKAIALFLCNAYMEKGDYVWHGLVPCAVEIKVKIL